MNTPINLAQYIDHTLLSVDATQKAIHHLCEEAKKHHFYTVCVNSGYVPLAKTLLTGSDIKICSVIGFPLGANLTHVKAFEASAAIEAGADEIDMVINIGWLKSGDWQGVKQDIQAVLQACGKTPLKVILETCLLTEEEIIHVCQICQQLQVAFVKTSTGFSHGGATIEHVRLMRTIVGKEMGVKASGGVRTRESVLTMIEAGATRIGTSSGVAIVNHTSNDEASNDY